MLYKFRRRVEEEKGFTLIELLVVILIIGILAAIAIPSFLSQTSKAHDAAAKSQARTAQTAAETLATDQNGSYSTPTAVSVANLKAVESTLNDTSAGASLSAAGFNATYDNVTGDSAANSYYVQSTDSQNGNVFTIARHSDGTVTRQCTTANTGGCPGGGTW